MREYLFRGKSREDGSWVFGDLIQDYSNHLYRIHSHSTGEVIPVLKESIGQYTGSTDATGYRIFEDDIVRFQYKSDSVLGIVLSKEPKGFRIYPYFFSTTAPGFFKSKNMNRLRFVSDQCTVIGCYLDCSDNLYKIAKQLKSGDTIMPKYEITFSSGRKEQVEDSRTVLEGNWKSGMFIKDLASDHWYNTSLIESVKRL